MLNKQTPVLKVWVNKKPRKPKTDYPPMAKLHPSRQRVMMRNGWGDYRLIDVPGIVQSGVIYPQCVEEGDPSDILILLTQKALVDGIIAEEDASILNSWLQHNVKREHNVLSVLLFDRIRTLLVDGTLGGDEQEEFLFFLKSIQGKHYPEDFLGCPLASPFDDPPPPVNFEGKGFCLLGQFAFGPRCECVAAIQELGGRIEQKISPKVDYIIIGTLCTKAWLLSAYSRKIQYALAMKIEGKKDIQIISETYWAKIVFNFDGHVFE